MSRLSGKSALVTGGASGIGLAIATALAREGARVHLCDVSAAGCAAAAAGLGAAASAHVLDIRDPAAIDDVVARVADQAGGIDVLVNCAGVFGMQTLLDITAAELERIFAVNFRGTLFVTQAVARHMIARGRGGAIVNVASGAARRTPPGAIAYAASKAAVISLTQGAALELIPHGIRVNAIAPGAVRTPMWTQVEQIFGATLGPGVGSAEQVQVAATPIGRMAVADDMAGAVVFLASADSAYVVGQTLNVDGGMTMG